MDGKKQEQGAEQETKAKPDAGGLFVLGTIVGAFAAGIYAYKRHEGNEVARRWEEEQRRQRGEQRLAEFAGDLQRKFDEGMRDFESRMSARERQVAEREHQAAERERQAREAAAREAKAAEERRDQHYRRREDARDRKFEAHEEGRSTIAADHVAQQRRTQERWFAERDAEMERLRQHGDFLRDLVQPTRPAAPVTTPSSRHPEIDAAWAELNRFSKGGLDG